jgi:hypothetical protein
MTDLTDPAKADIPETTPAEPVSQARLLGDIRELRFSRRPSQRFTVRTSAAVRSYASWERAIGAARSFAVKFGMASSVTDDVNGTRFDVAPEGCASPNSS